ncbi:MAG: hypothetical protein PF448_07035 [Bacteroidales bacterium]|jgi:tetratricopeptide (TPR) repeat protein|nr:hypothetical protein [Bacteroidales bacterium]
MKRIFLFMFCLIALQSFGQAEKVKVKFGDFSDIRDYRKAKSCLREANDNFIYMESNLISRDKSLENYLTVWELYSENAWLNYRIGYLYQEKNDYSKSLKFLQKASELDSTVSDFLHFRLGKAYQMNYKFDLALSQYLKFRQHLKTFKTTDKVLLELIRYEANCKCAKNILKDTLDYKVKNMGPLINSAFDDYGALVVNDTMYFTSQRIWNENSVTPRGKGYENIYFSCLENCDGKGACIYDKDLAMSNMNKNIAMITFDEKTKLFIVYNNTGELHNSLFYAKFENNTIQIIAPLLPSVISQFFTYSCCFNKNHTQVFMIGVRKDKFEAYNKEVCYSNFIDSVWCEPMNIGPVINTPFNEVGLFLSADGNTLYFSSQGHNSIGGYDIFKSELDENGNWSKPVNLGYPINTIYDDCFYWEAEDGSKAYLASNRKGGIGSYDIYQVIK